MTKEEAINIIEDIRAYLSAGNPIWRTEPIKEACDIAINSLETAERQRGRWIRRPHVYGCVYCSLCNYELKMDNTDFCPGCGADMRSDEV